MEADFLTLFSLDLNDSNAFTLAPSSPITKSGVRIDSFVGRYGQKQSLSVAHVAISATIRNKLVP